MSLSTHLKLWSYLLKEKRLKRINDKITENSLENEKFKFIWGIKEDGNSDGACFYTCNDIEIIYDKKEKKYILSYEGIFDFKTNEEIVEFLNKLLDYFTEYMTANGYDKKYMPIFLHSPYNKFKGDNIEELYFQFKLYVVGYEALAKAYLFDEKISNSNQSEIPPFENIIENQTGLNNLV